MRAKELSRTELSLHTCVASARTKGNGLIGHPAGVGELENCWNETACCKSPCVSHLNLLKRKTIQLLTKYLMSSMRIRQESWKCKSHFSRVKGMMNLPCKDFLKKMSSFHGACVKGMVEINNTSL